MAIFYGKEINLSQPSIYIADADNRYHGIKISQKKIAQMLEINGYQGNIYFNTADKRESILKNKDELHFDQKLKDNADVIIYYLDTHLDDEGIVELLMSAYLHPHKTILGCYINSDAFSYLNKIDGIMVHNNLNDVVVNALRLIGKEGRKYESRF